MSQHSFFGFTFSGIRSIFRKEMIQLMRDPYLVGFIIALPIIQLLVTGLAIQRDLKHIPAIVCNYDKRDASVELLKAFNNSTFIDIEDKNFVSTEEEVVQGIRNGRFRLGIIIPPDYSDKLLAGQEKANVNFVIDGTNATISKSILDGAQLIVSNHANATVNPIKMGLPPEALPTIDIKTKVLYNPDLKSSYFLIPGILGIIMHMMTILFTSFAIVRERETGTLEQLMVTPILTGDLMLGKVVPYAVIGFLDMILTLGVMVWFFNIAITGSFWFLCFASIIFILTSLGIGLMISTTCRTQVQAIQLTLAILLPSLLLTGFVFPLEPMPWFVKIISYLLPLTYYLEIIRGVIIKGTGLPEFWVHTVILMILAVITLGISMIRFKKQVA
ncbi:MAG: ABC transporter permease [Cyanobacteria bacterium]|nr:ABC transporter permease [Cyanobacteriota bacterium]